jgi:neutral trehalase
VIDALRFDPREPGFEEWDEAACVDATSHVYLLLNHAERWAERLGYERTWLHDRKESVKEYIRSKLYDNESGLFFDRWVCLRGQGGVRVFETLWPVIVGAATHHQAGRVINGHLLDSAGFFTRHPVPSVALNECGFSNSGWRGPARNSLVYWAAVGCVAYGKQQVAKQLLERALDQTAKQLEVTGLLWDMYHPEGLDPTLVFGNTPDALGHNPLIAMAVLWQKL